MGTVEGRDVLPPEENLEQEATTQVNQFIETVPVPEEHGIHRSYRLGQDRGALGFPEGIRSSRASFAGRIEGRAWNPAPAVPLGDRGRARRFGSCSGSKRSVRVPPWITFAMTRTSERQRRLPNVAVDCAVRLRC